VYNGYPVEEVESPTGCTKMGIEHMKNGLVTRGVLIDMPRLKGLPYLEPGTPVYPEDIEAWEKRAKVKLTVGDAIFLRTGRWVRREKVGPWPMMDVGEPGYHASVVPWLKQRDIAFIGADTSNDVLPSLVDGVRLPFHVATIVALGAYVFDGLDLEGVAETAAKLNRWEFMLTGAPLAVTGGTGGPVNLIAIF
jgi:kynurenine formamidase